MDYPDDIDIDSADDGPPLNEVDDEDSLVEEEMSNLKVVFLFLVVYFEISERQSDFGFNFQTTWKEK